MSTLKSLVARSNEGLSFRKKSKRRFGLGDFLAASTEQMLMTRGGYGSPQNYYSGPESWWDAPGGGAGGSSSSDAGTGGQYFYEWGTGAQGTVSDQSSSEGSSFWGKYGDNVIVSLAQQGVTYVLGKVVGRFFDTQETAADQSIIRNDSIIGVDGSYRGPANFRVLK